MKRVALFAHYDRDMVVDEHVLYYLRGLRTVAERILFVSDSTLAAAETAKLDGLAEVVSAIRHGEHDFGSWKRGFARLGDTLDDWDEVIVANDSCYAPVYPFEQAFARMADKPCDAWSGAATLDKGRIYLSSHFLVFRRRILADPAFRRFWSDIVAQTTPGEVVIRYEHGLSRMLQQSGYRLDSFVPIDWLLHVPYQGDYVRRLMPLYRAPWLKVRLYRDNHLRVVQLGKTLGKIDQLYPRRLVDAHIRRMIGTDDPAHYHYWIGSFRWMTAGQRLRIIGRTRRDRWWKVYVQVFGVTIFAFVLPLRHPRPIK